MRLIRIVGGEATAREGLAAALVAALDRRGFEVSVVARQRSDLALDRPGKDSHAHHKAGARDVAVVSAARFAVIHEARRAEIEPRLDHWLSRLRPVDIVLALGFDEPQGDTLRLDGFYAEFAGDRIPTSDPGALAERLAAAG